MRTWQVLRWNFSPLEIIVLSPALLFAQCGCGATYTADDATANTLAARVEARQLDVCAVMNAAACTPAFVRATSSVAFCANARELVAHQALVPEAGVHCQP